MRVGCIRLRKHNLGINMDEDEKLAEQDARQRPHAEEVRQNSLHAFTDLGFWPWNWSWFHSNSKQSEQEQVDNKPSELGKTRYQTRQKEYYRKLQVSNSASDEDY